MIYIYLYVCMYVFFLNKTAMNERDFVYGAPVLDFILDENCYESLRVIFIR